MKHFNRRRTIQEDFKERFRLIKPIVKFHGEPVLVHSVHDSKIFMKIIQEGKLKLPSKHKSPKKTPHMEKFLGLDDAIYYSLGFVYLSSYDWKYSLIFDIDYLKELIYFNKSINFQCYREAVNYWYENDRDYLDKLAKVNNNTKRVFDVWFNEKYNGEVRKIFRFWEIENELYEYIEKYPHKKKLLKIFKKTAKKHLMKYPDSKKEALKTYMEEYAPEIIGKKENDLLKNPHFLGFCIIGKMSKELSIILKEKYPDKILYDGKKIKKIKDLF